MSVNGNRHTLGFFTPVSCYIVSLQLYKLKYTCSINI
jgi:hypothetical protein